ncbi:MAG: hypothetical protein ABI396_14105 [Ktedonobacteraceae bacterium]
MQSERIYSAPSLVDVVKQLLIYRPTGVLTIWRAAASRRDEVRITVEQGRPIRVFWGASYIEEINESVLKRFNSWGEIHFSFQAIETRLLLPSPTHHMLQPEQPLSSSLPNNSRPQDFPRHATVTRPLPTVSPQSPQRSAFSNHGSSTPENTETVVATLTAHGRAFPHANLPRHERTIFLLINGRRTAVDLAQLTKRALDDVYVTLYRLQSLQLVTINTLPTAQNGQ